MSAVPISWFLTLSAILFALGVAGFLFRRNIITVFMSIELMLNAVNLNLIAFSRRLSDLTGQVFSVFVITIAAGEAAIGLALTISLFRQRKTLQQPQVRMAIQPVERDQFGGRSLHVAQVSRPFVLVHGRNHRLLVGEHLAEPVGVHDLDVSEVTKNLQNAPLVRRRLVAQHLIRQT